MDDTEQLLTAVEKTAHATPRRGKHPLPAALSTEDVAHAEAALGFPLPPLLTALYTRIANDGFGPEYGLLPLTGGPAPDGEQSVIAQYLAHRRPASEDGRWPWPEGVLPICSLGCGMYSCVDCRTDRTTVLLYEPNADDPHHAWYIDQPDLASWLRTWLDGTGCYGEDPDDEALEMQPWPDYNTRI